MITSFRQVVPKGMPPIIPEDELFYWSPEWLAGDKETRDSLRANGGRVFKNKRALMKYMPGVIGPRSQKEKR